MRNLLSANFSRLFKNKFYLAFLAFVLVFSFWFLLNNYSMLAHAGHPVSPDEYFFEALSCSPYVFAAFVALFVGREFSDNTIRNKILAGHTRLAIFFAAVLTSAVGCVIMLLVYALPQVTLGFMLLGLPTMPARLALSFLGLMMLSVFWSVLITAAVFLIQNQSVCVVASFVLITVMMFIGQDINNNLSRPETYWIPVYDGDLTVYTEPSEFVETENPYYVGGNERAMLEFLGRIDPAGQFVLLSSLENDKPEFTCLAVGLESIALFAAGVLLFQRKNIN